MAPHHYPDVISIHETFGAGLVGALVNAIMYGLTTLQTYLYYMYYPKDGRTNKLLVAIVWVIDTVHTVLVSMCIYFYLVSNYDNRKDSRQDIGHYSLRSYATSSFHVWFKAFSSFEYTNLPRLVQSGGFGGVLGFIVFAHLVFGILDCGILVSNNCCDMGPAEGLKRLDSFIKKDFSRLSEFTLFAATPFAITAVLADVLIAGSLCVLLHGSRTGFRSTDALVTTLIVYAVNRCLLTALMAIIEVIVFSLKSYALWYLAIDFVIGKLYANSFLATLNSRQALRSISGSNRSDTNYTDIEFESRPSFFDSIHSTHRSPVMFLTFDLVEAQPIPNPHTLALLARDPHTFRRRLIPKIKADTPIEVFEATPTTKFS
ncbi:hypothetical protein FA13DRAFT_1801262 [Coprinellus micaceus]|uniref:DUF6534 domain-containing protein n=1 Tax=Coprinellus micaceus TaxID=71717 RepID=A0A4Y7SEV4_COPMI|nr:hypothetical protein FA13DRAFT_1801262 [Coprinellus micaceus]